MNIYFLVEGVTESKIYPQWISYLIPEMERVRYYDEIETQNYYLFNAGGYPSIIDVHLNRAIQDVNSIDKYHYLSLCFDADEDDVQDRINKINRYLKDNGLTLNRAKLIFIVQNRCIETWLLGNRKIFKRNPQNPTLSQYVQFFDVSANDPEQMGIFNGFAEHQQFHKAYFKALCRERKIRYSERNPNNVAQKYYFDQLEDRVNKTNHILTFGHFIKFCKDVRNQISYTS